MIYTVHSRTKLVKIKNNHNKINYYLSEMFRIRNVLNFRIFHIFVIFADLSMEKDFIIFQNFGLGMPNFYQILEKYFKT